MDIHHDTSLKSILEDDSISSTSKTRICYQSSKGVGLWLITRPCIHLFHIIHFTFTSMLCFCLDLILLSTSNIFTCECGYGLDGFGTHLTHCLFESQQIARHDAIQVVKYAFAREWAHYMVKVMVSPYIRSFITSQFLHGLKGPVFCCQCGGY